jgi:hypothetical protein
MMTKSEPLRGYHRQWLRCRTCQRVTHHDYVPYSFSNPIMILPCGHGLTERDYGADEISADEARAVIAKAEGKPE